MSEKKKYKKRQEKKSQIQKKIDAYILDILNKESSHNYSPWHPFSKVTFPNQISLQYLVYKTTNKKIYGIISRQIKGTFLHLYKEERNFFTAYELFFSSHEQVTLRVEIIKKSDLGNKKIIFSKTNSIYLFDSNKFLVKEVSLTDLL